MGTITLWDSSECYLPFMSMHLIISTHDISHPNLTAPTLNQDTNWLKKNVETTTVKR